MQNELFRKYRFKFYLNASHSIFMNGRQGEVHPHTWELAVVILIQREDLVEFSNFERALERHINPYQNRTLNDLSPFNATMPTLENIVEYFGSAFREIIREMGGELLQVEGGETPSRSYVISYVHTADYYETIDRYSRNALEKIIDHLLDDIL